MKLEICIKPKLGRYQLWVAENDTDWTMHLRSTSAEEVVAVIGEHAERLRLETFPDVVVVDEDHKSVPVPTELKAALHALLRKTD